MPQHPPFFPFPLSSPSLLVSYCWWNIFLLDQSSSFSNGSHIVWTSLFCSPKTIWLFPSLNKYWNKILFRFLLPCFRVNWNNMSLYRCTTDACSSPNVLGWRVSPFSFVHVTFPPSQHCHCPYLFYLANVGHPCVVAISEPQSNSCVWSLPLAWFMGRCDARLSEGLPLSCYSSQFPT